MRGARQPPAPGAPKRWPSVRQPIRRAGALTLLGALGLVACTERVPLVSPAATDKDAAPADAPPSVKEVLGPELSPEDARPERFSATPGWGDGGCPRFGDENRIRIYPDTPSVIISLARTTSMLERKLGAVSRLQAVQQALLRVIPSYEGAISFGLQVFPLQGACASASGCCATNVSTPQTNNALFLAGALRCDPAVMVCDGGPEAPVFEALERIRFFYEDRDRDRGKMPRYVLLVLDGEPSCKGIANACELTAEKVADLRTRFGSSTLVLGIGEEAKGSECLEQLALRGATPTGPTGSFATAEAELPASLDAVFRTIAGHSCRIRLESGVDPSTIFVTLNNVPIMRDPTEKDGWNVEAGVPAYIRFFGKPCDAIRRSRSVREAVDVWQCN